MKIDATNDKPIFIQIAEQLEDNIFSEIFEEETQVPSTTEISTLLNINPHTVLKGMNVLVDEGILYKKRGVGMFVSEGAVQLIREKRESQFNENYIESLIVEAKKLKISKENLIKIIERGYEDEQD